MKKLNMIILALLSVFINNKIYSQSTKIIHEGQIEFEKRVNAYAILEEYYTANESSEFVTDYKANKPQFGTTNFTLFFNDKYSLYEPTNSTVNMLSSPILTTLNIVFSDLKKHVSISKKSFQGDNYLINDSTRKITWKITDQTKDIAGFNCRRANGLMMDSVYIVAFYTDQIASKGGPESFLGLPGMILGIALPRYHLTWFATKFLDEPASNLNPPTGGKILNNTDFVKIIKDNPTLIKSGKAGTLLSENLLF